MARTDKKKKRTDRESPNITGAPSPDTPAALGRDAPICSTLDDRLRRAPFAQAIAQAIAEAPATEGFAMGLVGPWGSGKTSILNMAIEILEQTEKHLVIRFNPWLFSGTDQLVTHFFEELSAQLIEQKGKALQTAGKLLHDYGALLKPFTLIPGAGSAVSALQLLTEAAAQGLQAATATPDKSLRTRRTELDGAIRKFGKRLVIVIDDIDRLRNDEIRDIMRLVKLTADFPNTVYVLAFDRLRVEHALSESQSGNDADGRAYLEKILQAIHDVPQAHFQNLTQLLADGIAAATANRQHGPSPQVEFGNVFHLVVRPLIRTVRDIRRYLGVLPATLGLIGDEVALPDVLALEAIRVFTPDVFAALPDAFELLTIIPAPSPYSSHDAIVDERQQLHALVASAGSRQAPIQEFLRRLFPATQRLAERGGMHYGREWYARWRRERRVAHPDVFRFYLEKSLPEGILPATAVRTAFDALTDADQLERIITALDERELEDLLRWLLIYAEDFPTPGVEPAVGVLAAQWERLPHGRRGFYDAGADLSLWLLLRALLARVEDHNEREQIVVRTLRRLRSLSAQAWLIASAAGSSEIISAATAERLMDKVRGKVLASSRSALAQEATLFGLLHDAHTHADDAGRAHISNLIEDDALLLAVLRTALLRTDTVGGDSVVATPSFSLRWDQLVEMFGAEHLATRVWEIAAAETAAPPDEQTAAALNDAMRQIEAARSEQQDDGDSE